jgi:hypothetical protein
LIQNLTKLYVDRNRVNSTIVLTTKYQRPAIAFPLCT